MRIVFMGTPDIAATVLARIADAHDVVAVYTRPDAVRGRGSKLVASPVKAFAESRGIPVQTPKSLSNEEVQQDIRDLRPDAICVVAYGAILPPEILAIPEYGCLNVHTSLLPRWRGAAPMQHAILDCDEATGVCVMRMEEGLDTGAFCKRVEVELDDAYLADLEDELANLGAKALVEALDDIAQGEATWTVQDESEATYAAKLQKGDLNPTPSETARRACAKVRASSAGHPARANIAGRLVTIERASVPSDDIASALADELLPGQLLFRAKRLFARASDTVFEIEALKPDGKKSMDARAFAAGVQGIKNEPKRWESA